MAWRMLWPAVMGHYDVASKHLVERWPEAILEVVFPRSRVQFLAHGPTELPEVKRLTDRVMRVRKDGREVLLHLEVQTEWQADVPARVANYRTRLRFATGRPAVSVVLCLAPPPDECRIVERFVEGKGCERIEIRFRVVRMWELSYPRVLLRRLPGLIPLAALSVETLEADLVGLNQLIEEAALAYEDKLDLQAMLAVMAGVRGFPPALLRSILKEAMVHEHPILKELEERGFERGMERGLAQGIEQGLERGLEQGRAEGQLRLIRRLLSRLGIELDAELDARLAQASNQLLEQIADDLVGEERAGVLDAMRRRLR